MDRKKSCLKKIIATAVFAVIILCISVAVTYLFRNVDYNRETVTGIYEEEDPLDVILIGPSTIHVYWQPLKAWNDYGIASYNYVTDSIRAEAIKYYMKEALETQSPELFVIDLRPFIYWSESINDVIIRRSTDSLSLFSPNRWQLVYSYLKSRTTIRNTNVISYYLEIAKYHSNYSSVLSSEDNWKYMDNKAEAGYKGFFFFSDSEGGVRYTYMEESEGIDTSDNAEYELSEGCLSVLYELLDFCSEDELQVLFVIQPNYLTDAQLAKYQEIKSILDKGGFECLDTTEYYDEMGLDFRTDFLDKNHVNIFGAEKYTEFLEEYLIENYDLPDHRGDESYADWDEEYMTFAVKLADEEDATQALIDERFDSLECAELLVQTDDAAEWALYAQSEYFIKIIVNQGTASYLDSVGIKTVLECLGTDSGTDDEDSEEDESGEDTSLSAEMPQQIVGGRYTISYGEQEEENVWNAVIAAESNGIQTETAVTITVSDDCSSVLIDGEEYCRGEDGLNIILFDQNRKTVVDSVTIVTDEDGDVVLER